MGKKNARADTLSRYRVPLQLDQHKVYADTVVAAVQAPTSVTEGGEGFCADAPSDQETLAGRQRADPTLLQIITYLESGDLPDCDKQAREITLSTPLYSMVDGILYRVLPDKSLRFVPPVVDRMKLFHEAHAGVFGAHLKGAKIHSQLYKHYWWPGMRSDITTWCRACLIGASHNVGRPERPPLVPIPVAGPFDRLGIDVLKLPKSRHGNTCAVVFMDYLTKWPEVFTTRDQSALTIAKLLVEEIISRHGVPHQLLSDRGPSFLSCLMTEVFRLMGIKVNTTAYHPQSDGLVERFNWTLLDMLAKTVKPGAVDWDERLPYVLFAYRAAIQASAGESPFFLLYGREPQLPIDATLCPSGPQAQVPYGSNTVPSNMHDYAKLIHLKAPMHREGYILMQPRGNGMVQRQWIGSQLTKRTTLMGCFGFGRNCLALPFYFSMYKHPLVHFRFQQDNDPKHTSHKARGLRPPMSTKYFYW